MRESRRLLLTCGATGILAFGALMLSLYFLIPRWGPDYSQLKPFVERMVPRLDDHRDREGAYPRNIDQEILLPKEDVPIEGWSYESDGKSFRFEVYDDRGTWQYGSDRRSWTLLN